MKIISLLTSFAVTLSLSQAFAGNLYCFFGEDKTWVPYTTSGEPIVVQVSPTISAYTSDCDGVTCALVFESFGKEDTVYEFNVLETQNHTSGEERVTCEDSVVTQTGDDLREFEDDVRKTLRTAEDDIQDLGRTIDRGFRSLFD